MTGLPGAGKSTLAMSVERQLFVSGYYAYVLDGDNLRGGLNMDLGFSAEDRTENIRRAGEVAALFADAGVIVVAAFISPFRRDRETARRAARGAFHEIYLSADLKTCESRDPKGMYRRAREGKIADFTGVSAPYEVPTQPELTIDTARNSVEHCAAQLFDYIVSATNGNARELSRAL